MLSILKNAAFIGLISVMLFTHAYAEPNSTTESSIEITPLTEDDATTVVLSYLSALQQGDTVTIKHLLGGKYLEKRRVVLDNPNYANTLSRIYSSATSKVLGTEVIDLKSMAVDTQIELSKDEILQSRFIIMRDKDQQLKIVEELDNSNL